MIKGYASPEEYLADMEVGAYWVPASGPSPAHFAYVGEHPGFEEVKWKEPLVGLAGVINWQIASRHAGLNRSGAYVTNWSKVPMSDDEKKKMSPEEEAAWTRLLHEEMYRVQPKVILALGGRAVEALLGPGYSLFWSNGIPFEIEGTNEGDRGGDRCELQVPFRPRSPTVVIPIINPAAGLHKSDLLQGTVQGYQAVRAWQRGELNARPAGRWEPSPQTLQWGGGLLEQLPVAIDTEGTKREPFCLTFSQSDSQAFIIYAAEGEKLAAFQAELDRIQQTVLLHNAPHDAAVCRELGIDVWRYNVVDTMVRAFNLQNLPRGLKPLTHRLLNIKMDDYEYVVKPWADREIARWRTQGYTLARAACEEVTQLTPKGKVKMSMGAPVVKLEGPELQLKLVKHVEREQNLSPQEEAWAENQLGERQPRLELKWVPKEIAEAYAGKDAAVTWAIAPLLEEEIKRAGLEEVARLDMDVLPLVDDMQSCGMHIDVERFTEVQGEFSVEKAEIHETILGLVECERGSRDDPKTQEEFNPGSSDQVARFCEFIYDRDQKLQLTKLTKSKTRVSTSDDCLKLVKDEHPFVNQILRYRMFDKYEGTYMRPLQKMITEVEYLKDVNGNSVSYRVFPQIRHTTVVSGRYSSGGTDADGDKTFNALAVPARTEEGLKVRSAFTAPPGRDLASWDLSQIELMIAAGLSKDRVMVDAFLAGLDLHSNLASKLFGVSYDSCNAKGSPGRRTHREPCKTIHYAMLYGASGGTIFDQLQVAGVTGFTRYDCENLLKETWKLYKGCAAWLDSAKVEVRQKGYVTDWLGRRRFLPGCQLMGDRWPIAGLRYEAERQAGNHRFQGGAAELLKRAMRVVWREVYPECKKRGIHFRLWLQIHDELMGEVQEGRFEEVNVMMQEVMSRDSWVIAPLTIKVEGKRGKNWGELK